MNGENFRYWVGMAASVLVALAGQAEQIPEPWRHYVSILGIIGTAVSGYMIQRPSEPQIKPRNFTNTTGE